METKQRPKSEKLKDAELRPDGWRRFERAIDAAVKVGPKHRAPVKKRKQNRA